MKYGSILKIDFVSLTNYDKWTKLNLEPVLKGKKQTLPFK